MPVQVADPFTEQRRQARQAGYSDQEINAYIAQNYAPRQPQQAQKKKPGGLRGAIASALPIVGGAIGSVLGTVAAPIAGTAAGGAIGSGAGAFLKQRLLGEEANLGEIGKEAALGAVPGVAKGAASLFKGARSAAGGAKAVDMATDTSKAAVPVQTTEQAMLQRSPSVRQAASHASKGGYGLTVGQSAGRGKVLTPEKADETYNFITQGSQKYGGIRPGKPIDQATDAQNVFNNVTKSLDDTLEQIDRPLQVHEPINIAANIIGKVRDNPAITKATTTAEKFAAKVQKAKSIKELEAIRREADDLAYTASGAGKTSAAAQAKAVREAIDDFVSPLSPEYKAIKGDYTLARDALETTSKANKSAKGFKPPFVDIELGKQAIPGAKNKAAAKLAGDGLDGTPPPGTPPTQGGGVPTGFRPYIKPAIQQGVTRAVVSPFLAPPQEEQQQEQLPDLSLPSAELPASPAPGQDSAFSNSEEVQRAYLEALAAGETETAKLLLAGYEKFGGGSSPQQLNVTKVTSQQYGLAQSGVQSLQQLKQMLQSDSGVVSRTATPGGSLPVVGGYIRSAAGVDEYDALGYNIADTLIRLRTGAAATESEVRNVQQKIMPRAGDSAQAVQTKLQQLDEVFGGVLGLAGKPLASPSVDDLTANRQQ